VPAGIHHLTKVAELTIHPQLVPQDIKRIRGSVQIYTSLSASNNDEPTLQIPFRTTVIHGSIDYDKETTFVYIPSSSIDLSKEKTKQEECRPVIFMNRFHRPIIIYNVTTDKTELISQYIKVNYFEKLILIASSFIDFFSIDECFFTICIC
jgi:hypothetical protein